MPYFPLKCWANRIWNATIWSSRDSMWFEGRYHERNEAILLFKSVYVYFQIENTRRCVWKHVIMHCASRADTDTRCVVYSSSLHNSPFHQQSLQRNKLDLWINFIFSVKLKLRYWRLDICTLFILFYGQIYSWLLFALFIGMYAEAEIVSTVHPRPFHWSRHPHLSRVHSFTRLRRIGTQLLFSFFSVNFPNKPPFPRSVVFVLPLLLHSSLLWSFYIGCKSISSRLRCAK